MRKSFVQNIAFLILINLIVKPFWVLGIDRNVQNIVGHEVFGIYQAMFNVSVIFNILLDLGLHAYNTRVISRSPLAMRNLFANIFVVKLIFAAIYLFVIFAYGFMNGLGAFSFQLLLLSGTMQIALSFLIFFRSNIAAMQLFRTDSLFSVFDRLIAIIILGIILFSATSLRSNFTIEWYAWVQLIAYGISALVAFFVCRQLQKIGWRHFKFKRIRGVLRQSIPYAVLIFLMALYMRIDVVLLEYISADARIAGRYAAAFRILDVSNNMSGVLIAGILLPLFAKMIAKKENYRSVADLSISLLIPFSVCLTVICTTWGYDIMQLMYRDIGPEDATVLSWLMGCFPFYCINYVYSTLLTANGDIRTLIGNSAVAVLLALTLNLTMLSAHDPANAVIAARNSFITVAFVAMANLFFSHKKLRAAWGLARIARYLAFTISLAASAYLMDINLTDLPLFIKMALTSGFAMVLTLATGIIHPRSLMQQLKKLFSRP